MTRIDRIREWVAQWNEEALLADGFEDAIVGICERVGAVPVVAYDRDKCIEILMDDFRGDVEEGEDLYTEAVEYFEYNVAGGYVGDGTPVFLTLFDEEAGV